MRIRFPRSLAISVLAAVTACAAPSDEGGAPSVARRTLELDDMGKAPEGMELFLLDRGASLEAVRETFERVHGSLVHYLPPRLIVGKVPAGSDTVLRDSGVISRFARAVSPSELADLDTRESRFVRVFSSRYYPETTQPADKVSPTRAVRPEGEPFETSENPSAPPFTTLMKTTIGDDDIAEQNERNVFVPYASGRIVISVILPESNGVGEPSTEDWNDQYIAEVYAKIQAGAEVIQRHEPNADLSFVFHYESAPAPGGVEGTVDVDYEYGKQAWGGQNLSKTYAQIYSRILGREVQEWDYWQAQQEYLSSLKDRYAADGAFITFVAANQNFTAGFRAYASFNGPSTSLDSSYGFEVFAHEYGHIFGALDEYCPDACIHPSSMHGYLGIVNANAQYRADPFGGIRGGRGESQGSLMMYNVANGVNGYTRGAWGWLDTDGDGIVEVRDTSPTSDMRAEVEGSEVRLSGRIVDVPATPNWATPYSVNRIRALHVRKAGATSGVRIPVFGTRRGREDLQVSLGALPAGHYELDVLGENSVGNVQRVPQRLSFDVTGEVTNARPIVSLSSDIQMLSPSASAGVTASTLDLDGDAVQVRFDVDGDGRYDTAFSRSNTVWIRPNRAGLVQVGVEARDARGALSTAVLPLYVLEENAPAVPGLPLAPSPVFGTRARLAAVGEVNDAERQSVQLNYKLERDDYQRSLVRESGFGVPRAHVFDVETPASLLTLSLDLNALDGSIDRWTYTHDAVRLGSTTVALALGELGVAIVDLTDKKAPRLLSRLALQTAAYDLSLVQGGTLFVWGDKLTVVDVRNPQAPVEILQKHTTRNTRRLESHQPWQFDEQFAKPMSLWSWYNEQVEHLTVEVAIDHPRWEELRVSVIGPRGETAVIWDHAPRGQNQQAITANDTQVEALRQLIGTRAVGDFRIEVIDDVINGSVGTITRAALAFDTAHRGFQPDLVNTSAIVGSMGGQTLVLSGAGVQAVDIKKLDQLKGRSLLATEHVQKAEIVGDRIIGVTVMSQPTGDGRASGLFAVDASKPNQLRLLRSDASVTGEAGFALAGTRFYASSWRDQTTRVGSVQAFLSGASFWLGQSPVVLGADVLGDDRSLWVAHGAIERFDVSNPNAIRSLERFEDPYAYSMRFFDAQNALILGSASELWQVDLTSRSSLISEVYRLTAQAKDARGAGSEVSRSVHVVPYDRAPVLHAARFVRASTTRDPYELEVTLSDPDNHPSWDPYTAVRVDWDGDGIYDGNWINVWDVGTVMHTYTEAGDYLVRVQARDGFYALSNELTIPLHVEAYVPVACTTSADCPSGDYCEPGANGCGGEGVCQRAANGCWGFVSPVCGCDGETYKNICDAHERGAAVAQWGVCPHEVTRCGGPEGVSCSVEGMFCRYAMAETEEQSCGAAQAYGDCVYPPSQCWSSFDAGKVGDSSQLVCGCDGNTYSSSCWADAAGVSVQHLGPCGTEGDCLDTGCAQGETCMSCWAGWACVPEGASC